LYAATCVVDPNSDPERLKSAKKQEA